MCFLCCVLLTLVLPAEAARNRFLNWEAVRQGRLPLDILEKAMTARAQANARGIGLDKPLTIIDYTRHSSKKRLWVVDPHTGALLMHERVAHGRNSGDGHGWSRRFSNVAESRQTSLGMFVTAETYVGKHGYSLRMDGLEPGFNDRARERAIVIHGADYMSDGFLARHGRAGRSWGCPAVSREASSALIDMISGGGLVFAYYPEEAWLAASTLLNPDRRLATVGEQRL
jgi:hypothetical protein